MERGRWLFVLWSLAACSDEGVGAPCKPSVPCDVDGANCGFDRTEAYVTLNATDCPGGQACVVYQLDDGSEGTQRADPNVPCTSAGSPPGCVSEDAIARAIYCSCQCASDRGDRSRLCTCGEGFRCASAGGAGDGYCVKR